MLSFFRFILISKKRWKFFVTWQLLSQYTRGQIHQATNRKWTEFDMKDPIQFHQQNCAKVYHYAKVEFAPNFEPLD